jgi:acylphosphatase
MRTVEIQVTGLVQGVFYRATAYEIAIGLGLRGWVRNCADGSVRAFAQGDDDSIEKFIEWCRVGPGKAKVDAVNITEKASDEILEKFEIKRG